MIFDGRRVDFRNQNRSKIDVKNDAERGLAQESHFDQFLMDFGSNFGPQNHAQTMFVNVRCCIYAKYDFEHPSQRFEGFSLSHKLQNSIKITSKSL